MSLELVPIDYAEACSFVARQHRHHPDPPPGWKFGVGVATTAGELVGVAMVGRPVSPVIQSEGYTLECNRTCTDGYPNANSMLYGAVSRAAFALGYHRVITYTQKGESGASLRAAGWRVIAERKPRKGWNHPGRPRVVRDNENIGRFLWEHTNHEARSVT
jgi:hypothetical protein